MHCTCLLLTQSGHEQARARPFLNAAVGCYDLRQSLGRNYRRRGGLREFQHAIALAVVAGLGLGVVATRGLAAQAKRTFYVVIEVDEITDADGYKAMTKLGPANIVDVKHADGRYLARTDNLTALDGAAPKRFVMIAFDSMDKANGLYQNTKEMTAMRIKATKSRAFIVEGL